jgi:7-alpha-hydroxysteroid dehydrogenase
MADASSTARGRLAGRTAIVTGASRGIGRAIAVAVAAEGAAVAVVARSESVWDPRLPGTVHETVAEIVQAGGRAIAVPADLGRPADIERVVDVTRAELGPVTVLVNNAALTVPGRPKPSAPPAPADPPKASTATPGDRLSFLNFPLKGYRTHFDVGVFAAFQLMQLVIPDMVTAGQGAVVNITSVASAIPGEGPYQSPGGPTAFAYGGNKAALEHLTRAVAFEVAPHGVAVNALSPSAPILTPGNLIAAPATAEWASAEEFAEAAVLLALATPETLTGTIAFSDDVLHPELGRRGWRAGNLPGKSQNRHLLEQRGAASDEH